MSRETFKVGDKVVLTRGNLPSMDYYVVAEVMESKHVAIIMFPEDPPSIIGWHRASLDKVLGVNDKLYWYVRSCSFTHYIPIKFPYKGKPNE